MVFGEGIYAKYMYTYVGVGTRAPECSELDRVLNCFEKTRAEVHLSARCFLEVPQLARLSRPCRGRRRSCSRRVVVGYANITFFMKN